jgi:hypothetical protein
MALTYQYFLHIELLKAANVLFVSSSPSFSSEVGNTAA